MMAQMTKYEVVGGGAQVVVVWAIGSGVDVIFCCRGL